MTNNPVHNCFQQIGEILLLQQQRTTTCINDDDDDPNRPASSDNAHDDDSQRRQQQQSHHQQLVSRSIECCGTYFDSHLRRFEGDWIRRTPSNDEEDNNSPYSNTHEHHLSSSVVQYLMSHGLTPERCEREAIRRYTQTWERVFDNDNDNDNDKKNKTTTCKNVKANHCNNVQLGVYRVITDEGRRTCVYATSGTWKEACPKDTALFSWLQSRWQQQKVHPSLVNNRMLSAAYSKIHLIPPPPPQRPLTTPDEKSNNMHDHYDADDDESGASKQLMLLSRHTTWEGLPAVEPSYFQYDYDYYRHVNVNQQQQQQQTQHQHQHQHQHHNPRLKRIHVTTTESPNGGSERTERSLVYLPNICAEEVMLVKRTYSPPGMLEGISISCREIFVRRRHCYNDDDCDCDNDNEEKRARCLVSSMSRVGDVWFRTVLIPVDVVQHVDEQMRSNEHKYPEYDYDYTLSVDGTAESSASRGLLALLSACLGGDDALARAFGRNDLPRKVHVLSAKEVIGLDCSEMVQELLFRCRWITGSSDDDGSMNMEKRCQYKLLLEEILIEVQRQTRKLVTMTPLRSG